MVMSFVQVRKILCVSKYDFFREICVEIFFKIVEIYYLCVRHLHLLSPLHVDLH